MTLLLNVILQKVKVYKDYYLMNIMNLNINDKKLLDFCKDEIKSVSDIARELNIAPKNVSVRLYKLEKSGLIKVQKKGHGKKTFVKTIKAPSFKHKKLAREILEYVKQKQKEGYSVLEFGVHSKFKEKVDYFEILKAMNFIKMNSFMGFVVTEEGEKFLREKKK